MVARRDTRLAPTPLAQRTLRNEISRVLRDAESGERFAVKVNGRVVAELGPPGGRLTGTDWQTAHEVIRQSRAHVDPGFWNDSGGRQADEIEDAWERAAKRNS